MSTLFMGSGCIGNGETQQTELTISAAASLADALQEVKDNFEKEHNNIKINYSFGSSGSLQEQISQGAPVDLFFSAAEDKFSSLVEEGIVDQKESTLLLTNKLVLIKPKDKTDFSTFEDIVNHAERISIGIPESVPAGKYAKETFEFMDLWETLQEKIVYAKDVRQVLTYVETENVDAGLVYNTDAMFSKEVEIVEVINKAAHTPILYPLGIIKDTKHGAEASLFYEYLKSEASAKVFTKYGFGTIQQFK
ncbi:molybdate ABC transporter substrate-binding protein [Bacillus sp. AK128]